MRVISALADIDFGIGRIEVIKGDMVITSSADSTIKTSVTVTPRESLAALGKLLTTPAVWLFVLKLPFVAFTRQSSADSTEAWTERRKSVGLNKPW